MSTASDSIKKTDQPQWFPLYTKPRWEKKLNAKLIAAGYTSYCPVQRQRRKWKNRYKIVEEPIFRSYLFVQIPALRRFEVLNFPGALRFVNFNKKPGIVRDEEILMIKRFLGECEIKQAGPVEVIKGDIVEVVSGVFAGSTGEAEMIKGGFIMVHLQSMGVQLRASIHKSNVVPVRRKKTGV